MAAITAALAGRETEVCVFCGAEEDSHRVVEDGYLSYVPCADSIGATIGAAPLVHPDEDDWPACAKSWLGE